MSNKTKIVKLNSRTSERIWKLAEKQKLGFSETVSKLVGEFSNSDNTVIPLAALSELENVVSQAIRISEADLQIISIVSSDLGLVFGQTIRVMLVVQSLKAVDIIKESKE